jgi:hypothetical protein
MSPLAANPADSLCTSSTPADRPARRGHLAARCSLACGVAIIALLSIPGSQARAAAPGLVAAYAFGEGGGTTSADQSGHAHVATLSNVTWTTGRYGRALSFNGNSSIAEIADAADLDLASGMTIEAWIRPASTQTGARTIAAKSGTAGAFPYGLELRSGRPGGFVRLGSTSVRADAPSSVAAKAWTFVATTFDGSAIRTYVGGRKSSEKQTSGTISASASPLELGANSVSGDRFKGAIDNVRLYSRALSSTELTADMATDVSSDAVAAPTPSPTPTPTPSATPTPTATPGTAGGWTTVIDDRFDSGGVPTHWSLYDGPYGSGPGNCAAPSQVSVSGGSMHMLMSYRTTGRCGSGWYTAGMQLDRTYAAVDQRVTLRYRVVNTDPVNVRSHRNMPMHFGDVQSPSWPAGGEIDYCEGSALTDCTLFAHWRNGDGSFSQYTGPDMHGDFTQFRTVQATRLNYTLSVSIDGVSVGNYAGTAASIPDVLQRAVLQQECRSAGCPSTSLSANTEDIQVDWVTVENAR